MRCRLLVGATLCLSVQSLLTTPSLKTSWHVESIVSVDEPLPPAQALVEGDAVITLPCAASDSECRALRSAASQVAAEERNARRQTGLEKKGLVRVPSVDAAARAAEHNTPCAAPLPQEADALLQSILLRTMSFIDSELPTLASALFDDGSDDASTPTSIRELFTKGELEFSSREPTVNVYTEGGEFLAHKDHQALTVLIPLSPPDAFDGGGTAFWSQDSRGHRVAPPDLVLRPAAGTCMLFGGHTTHSGTAVEAGERCVLVASFSRQKLGGRAERAREAAAARDIYGDLI